MRRSPRTAVLSLAAAALLATAVAGCTDDGGSTKAFCAQVKEVPALESVLARFSEADRDVLDERIEKARTAYADLAAAAPDEIAAETDEVVSLVDAILDAVEEHPTDPAKASAQLRTAMAEHKGVDADRAKVAAFAKANCDVQLDATLTEGATSTTTSTTISGLITTSTAVTSSTTPGG